MVVGHTGSAYGLISAYFYHEGYTVAYVVNGALNGYKYSANTFFEVERQMIHDYTYDFVFGAQDRAPDQTI